MVTVLLFNNRTVRDAGTEALRARQVGGCDGNEGTALAIVQDIVPDA
jgi:hypothetical protein